MPNKFVYRLLFGLSVCALFSCYEKKVGCLDVLALNFDLDADEDCCQKGEECCCEYPQLVLSVKHQYGSSNLSGGGSYLTDAGQPFNLDHVRFFISNVRLLTDHGPIPIDDSILIKDVLGNDTWRPDDVTPITTNNFSFSIGTFLQPGAYHALQFTVGLSEPESSAPAAQFESGHPLSALQKDLRDASGNLLAMKITWKPDPDQSQSEQLNWPAGVLGEVILPVDLTKPPGFAITLSLVIDYQEWFGAIDLVSDSPDSMRQKILAGLSSSFSIL